MQEKGSERLLRDWLGHKDKMLQGENFYADLENTPYFVGEIECAICVKCHVNRYPVRARKTINSQGHNEGKLRGCRHQSYRTSS
jgi:hypothetical protein